MFLSQRFQMIRNILISALVLIMVNMRSAHRCSPQMCFTWKVSKERLTLICKVSHLNFRVSIVDPKGNTQADCSPPFPSVHCKHYYSNGSITQNPSTNETFFIVTGSIDYHYNGIWTCRHGARLNFAYVEVTVLRKEIQAQNTSKPNEPLSPEFTDNEQLHCTKDVLLFSMTSFILFTVASLVLISLYPKAISVQVCSGKSPKYAIKRRCSFAFLTVSFFLFTFMIGYFDDRSCIYIKWILTVFGGIIGTVGSCLFLTVYDDANVTENDNDDAEQPLETQGEEVTLV